MRFTTLILATLSLVALTDATRITFSVIGGRIYAETDQDHFAIFGQTKDKDGARIVSVDEDGQYLLKGNCDSDWTRLENVDAATKFGYNGIRTNHLAETRIPKESPCSYVWSDSFSSDQRDFSVVRLEPQTIVYSSQFFPSKLAKVVISGNVVVFVHYDGTVRMKYKHCLYLNEKILIEGLQKINPEAKKSFFSKTGERVLRDHLRYHPIDATPYGSFDTEQMFLKTYTTAELEALKRLIQNGAFAPPEDWKP